MPDKIEKSVLLNAPLARVWAAIANADQFGIWFGVSFEGPFVAGVKVRGKITPTQVDEDVAKMQKPFEGTPFEFDVVAMEPMRAISFRWHPYAIEPGVDYSAEPKTLIRFELQETAEGTLLLITESGFDAIPLARRAKAFAANEGGWSHQSVLIGKYLARA
jgi:uncharacterized protein YndB with AHSA1/START domain